MKGKDTNNRTPPRKIRLGPGRPLIGVALVTLACWYAGASQGNGAATLLGSILVGTALVSAVWTVKNLDSLQAQVIRFDEAFAEGEGMVTVCLRRLTANRGIGLAARADLPGAKWVEPQPADSGTDLLVRLPWSPERRGTVHLTDVRVRSVFPLGWFVAEVRLSAHSSTLVYPRPFGPFPLPITGASDGEAAARRSETGTGDFFGHKLHRDGEAQRRVDWKASARSEQILLKRFTDAESTRIRLQFQSTPGADTEAKLSQLCRWVLDAEKAGALYALELPHTGKNYGRGGGHLRECLQMLARFPA